MQNRFEGKILIVSILKKIPVFPLLALGISILFFARFIDNYFVYDDFRYIENTVHGLKHVLLGYNTLRVVSNAIWLPLYSLFGFNPVGYNLLNIALYALNAVLFFYFVLNLFKSRFLAFNSGLFFVLSGVGADVVLWKCADNSLLSMCFYLLTLLCYLRFRKSGDTRSMLLSLACYCLAMFSKEDAASLPAIILVIEYLFPTEERLKKTVFLRVLPFCAIIGIYLFLNKLVFGWLALAPAELERFFQIRPVYSLVCGFGAFFLSPDGILNKINPLAYFSSAAVFITLLLVKDRKIIFFAFFWIVVTFLPQSLTAVGQLEPQNLPNSISRYLYIVSIGPAMVYAALMLSFKERFSSRVFIVCAATCFGVFGWINYTNVQQRGWAWKEEAAPVAHYFIALDKIMPSFPPNSFVYVDNAPTGRAFVQQAMRAYYRHPSITWINNPASYQRKPGEKAFFIDISWGKTGVDWMQIHEPWPITVGQ